MQNLSYHQITRLELGRIQHFPAEDGRHQEFWKRDLIVKSGEESITIPLFSDCYSGLLTDDERSMKQTNVRANSLTNIQPIPVTIR